MWVGMACVMASRAAGAGPVAAAYREIQPMAFKNLLIHLDDSKACTSRVAAAIELARAHEAHLTGLYVAADPVLPGNLRAEVPSQFLTALDEQADARAQAAVAGFAKALEKNGLVADTRTARCLATEVPQVVALHARYADLVIVGQPEGEAAGAVDGSLAEDVVLAAGRPVLIIPYIGAGKHLGRRVLIAWDAGREAARAVNDALPFLKRADQVTALVIDPHKGNDGPEPGADIALHLTRHGVKVEARSLTAGDLSVADALLSRSADLDIDLVVMGGYGHSRLREWVLGGVTRQIFEQMTVPVLMSH
ncbi:MAG: universal stress protein [Hyphomicrobiales bacterium]|nr:MAG: universal stress protein [Hyphomicrobiales bacterium]